MTALSWPELLGRNTPALQEEGRSWSESPTEKGTLRTAVFSGGCTHTCTHTYTRAHTHMNTQAHTHAAAAAVGTGVELKRPRDLSPRKDTSLK